MRIGIAFDLKDDVVAPPGAPDDFHEEYDSAETIEALAQVLRQLGHEVILLGDGTPFLQRLLQAPPDFVFNTAEGHGISRSREARVPAVLEMLGIPHTGSDPLALAVTLDKDCARRLVSTAGVAVPAGVLVGPPDDAVRLARQAGLSYPAIVKPAWEGSSKGIRGKCVVESEAELVAAVAALGRDHLQPVLVEEFIQGDELTVGMLGNDPPAILGIMRVLPVQPTERFVYSLEVKRDYLRQVHYESPPTLPTAILETIEASAQEVFRVLGLRDVARVDFRLRDGIPYFLEVNPLPGLNPVSSDLMILGRLRGWNHARIVETILQAALTRTQSNG